jgi:hypothetical protein
MEYPKWAEYLTDSQQDKLKEMEVNLQNLTNDMPSGAKMEVIDFLKDMISDLTTT